MKRNRGFEPRPQGDPYETVFGINILWNLLTYNAWLVRFWDHFPDQIPQYQAGLALWGLIRALLIPCSGDNSSVWMLSISTS